MTSRLLTLLLVCLLGVGAWAEEPASVDAETDVPASAEAEVEGVLAEEVSIEDIRVFTAVFREVQRSYVEPVGIRQLMRAAIRGLLSDLDPHSAYLERSELKALNEDSSGEYAGLGVEVQVRGGQLVVIAPIDDSPAARAGIQPGDVITRIDEESIGSANAAAAIERMRGPAGTKVKLTILRAGQAPLDLELTRETIAVAAVRAQLLAKGFGYVRIAAFQTHTAQQVARRIGALVQPGQPLDGLVLDLRSNPGGLLESAVQVSDLFLDGGPIVSTRGRVAAAAAEFAAAPGDILQGAPLVVLIDGGSASASEIVAGALQDRKRGLVLGQRSFGKGSVQSVLPLESGEAIKLTTALYYTPSGRSIQAEGIEPDVHLQTFEMRPVQAQTAPTEADLPGHLRNGTGPRRGARANQEADPADNVLREALHVLRALARMR